MSAPAKKAPAAPAAPAEDSAPPSTAPAPAPERKPSVFISPKGFAFTRNYSLITIHAGQVLTDIALVEDIKKNGGEVIEVDPSLLVKCPHCARTFVQKQAG
jgi:hypothetical protein